MVNWMGFVCNFVPSTFDIEIPDGASADSDNRRVGSSD